MASEDQRGLSLTERAAATVLTRALQATAGAVLIGLAATARDLPGRERKSRLFQDELMFPLDLITNANKYYMSLKFVKYTKRSITDRKDILSQGNIYLPIPNQLNDTTVLSYSNDPIGPLLGSFVEAAGNQRDLEARAAVITEGAGAAITQLISGAPGGPAVLNAASALSGNAINPFITVVFKGPQFKTHSFSWKLFPKSKQESDRLTKIVQTIKYHISPGLLNGTGVIFEYPEMVLLKIFPTEENLYTFKPCIIKSLNVNYAPSGGPSFFRNNLAAPTGIELKIELQEIEYFTKFDIDQDTRNDKAEAEALVPWMPGGFS